MPLQYVVHLRDDLFGCDCDFAAVHNLLVHAPVTHGVPFETLLPRADALMEAVPVSRLKTMCDETLTDLIAADQCVVPTVTQLDTVISQLRAFHLSLAGLRCCRGRTTCGRTWTPTGC